MMDGLLTDGALVAIGLMLATTLIARMAGFFILGRVTITPRVRRGLEALPGAVIISTIVPIALREGLPAILALAVTAALMKLLKRDVVAVVAGLATVALMRQAGF